jgi:hypothetical protein
MPQVPNRPTKLSSQSGGASSRAGADNGKFTLNRWWRRGISLLVTAHLIIVVAVPLAMVRPASPLARAITSVTRPYIEMTQASHGYSFFAPRVGPSHLLEYGYKKQGQPEPKTQLVPDIKKLWPRLRYHRHFMLAEKLMANYEPRVEDQPEEIPAAGVPQSKWEAERAKFERQLREEEFKSRKEQRAMYQALARSYAQHLLAGSDADEVELWLKRHIIPSPLFVAAGVGLEEKESYLVIDDSVVTVRKPSPSAEVDSAQDGSAAPKERPIAIPGDSR